jgi:hypothetical protein
MGKAIKKLWSLCRILNLTRFLSDEKFIRFQYWVMMGKKLRNPPIDFNEKLQWLKLHYRNPSMVTCADKWAVREFVKERIGEKYLAECIGVYDDVEEIPFAELPNQFVLKATHGSGWNIICPGKSKIDWCLAKEKMRKWLKSDFSKNGREWQYHEIKPQIICEKFLIDPETPVLRDYKLLTFKGETKYIWVDFTEKIDSSQADNVEQEVGYSKPKVVNGLARYRNIYDSKWNFMPGRGSLHPSKKTDAVKKPECFEEMIEVARKLASDFPQCRVDLYVLGGRQIIFGELTFTSGNGCNAFYPQSFNDELGSYIALENL